MTTYTTTKLPGVNNAGLSAQLTDIASTSKIDVVRLLGRPASKIIINVEASQIVDITLNSAKRILVPFKSGVVDINGNTSTLPEFGYGKVDSTTGLTVAVTGADNTADRLTNAWGGNPGAIAISVADGSQTANVIWNSYDSYGDLPITSLEITHSGASTDIVCTFVA